MTKLHIGRSPLATDDRGRVALRDRVETLWARRPGVRPLFRPTTLSELPTDLFDDIVMHARSLPPLCLSDGTRPFVKYLGEPWYGGVLELTGLSDPRIDPVWRACLESEAALCAFTIDLGETEPFTEASISLDQTRDGGPAAVGLTVDCWPRRDNMKGTRALLDAFGLKSLMSTGITRRPDHFQPGDGTLFMLENLPRDPTWPSRVAAGLDRLGWASLPALRAVSFMVMEYEGRYEAIRARLNAISRSWNAQIRHAGYVDGFDPFVAPPPPPPGEEYRFPVAVHLGADGDSMKPTLEVDVVHLKEGSFLEFLTARSVKTLRKYADLADVEPLELWTGARPEDRWGEDHPPG